MRKLVILESPGKIKKVSQFLKEIDKMNNYIVKASIGHIRELSRTKEYNMGIDLTNMSPDFIISNDKKSVVKDLIETAQNVDEVIIATDPDREGEAISWHLYDILKKYNTKFKRIRLNSITKKCVEKELNNMSEIDQNYVNSALTRQLLDKIVGFRLSPILQKTIGGSSAGRVQSAVLRILANRQKEIESFDKKEYWFIQDIFTSGLVLKNYLKTEADKFAINKIYQHERAKEIFESLGDKYTIEEIKKINFEENKFKPFSTADMLKAAKSKLKFKTKDTTKIAQTLYEKGLITYIRTDSNNLDNETEEMLKNFVIETYGFDKLGKLSKTVSKESIQKGHPAITPTHFEWLPENIESNSSEQLSQSEKMLYALIWQNTINSIYQKPSGVKKEIYLKNNNQIFYCTTKNYLKQGYFEIDKTLEIQEEPRFDYSKGQTVKINNPELKSDFDQPPSKLNEISLIEQLQKLEIGRPSTYKTSVEVNVLRNYVEVEKTKSESMVVNDLGMRVNDFLEQNFSEIISLDFTKKMEKDLDSIAQGKIEDYKSYLKNFYFKIDNLCNNFTFDGEKCEKCNKGFIVDRSSKKGTNFKGCSNYPNCDFVEFNQPDYSNNKSCKVCKKGYMVERSYIDKKTNKTKKFKGCSNYPECKNSQF